MRQRTITVAVLAGSLALGFTATTAGAADTPDAPTHAIAAAKQRSSVTLRVGTKATTVAKKVPATIQVKPAGKRTVEIQTRSETNTWETVAKAKTNSSGKLKTTFTTYKSGDYKVRAVAHGNEAAGQMRPVRRANSSRPTRRSATRRPKTSTRWSRAR